MKKNLILTISGFLFIIGVHFHANSQTNCYASFQIYQAQDSIWFNDYSFTTDSLTDYVNSWTWTVTGMGVSYTFSAQNPAFFYNFFPQGYYTICLTIGTLNGCMNQFCQQGVFLGGNTPCPIIINAQVYNVSIPNGSDGAVDITASNSTPPYNFIWNTGATTEDLYFIPSGFYSVTVSDANCSAVFSTSVLEPYDSTITNCFAAFLVAQNPTQDSILFVDYSFTTDTLTDYVNSWTWTVTGMGVSYTFNGQDQQFLNSYFAQGYYTICLTIGTANGCMNQFCQQGVFMGGNSPCPIIINAQVFHVSIPNGSDGAIDITASNGVPPYNYIWNTGATTEDLYFIPSGFYSVTVSDTNCAAVYSTSVIEPYDSTITYYDSLLVPPIDTCFGFVPDSFYISNVVINGNDVIITWVFTGSGMIFTLPVTYTFSGYGNYIAAVTINCNDKSFTSTYMSYVRLFAQMSVEEFNTSIQVYPNPARDKIYIGEGLDLISVALHDVTGSLVDRFYGQNVIDINHLQSGLYSVIIQTSDSKIVRKLIITK